MSTAHRSTTSILRRTSHSAVKPSSSSITTRYATPARCSTSSSLRTPPLLRQRHFSTTAVARMPQMPKNIIKGGKDDLKLSNKSLLINKGYIAGSWVDSKSGQTLEVLNKATQASIGSVPDMGLEDVKLAIDAAYDAGKEWKGKTSKERSDLLTALFNELQANAEDLAKIIVGENGKSLTEAKGEIAYSNSFIQWFAAEAQRTYGQVIPAPLPGVRNVVIKQPVGVVGLITPWNFPAAMITRKLGPALAAGCTAVIKVPAETPYSGLAIAYLAEKVGVPKGVVNVVVCAKGENEAAVGKELCQSPKVKKISFTGSTRVGKILMSQCSGTLKKMSMELGGNAPFIVFEDADLDKAVEGAIACKFRGSGQTCVCANRLYVHESVYDDFAQRLAKKVDAFKLGNGLDEGTTHGPLVNQAGLEKVEAHVRESVKAGAKVLLGGNRGEGTFFEPTILVDIPPNPPTDTEETFGPLASLYRFKDEADVVRLCNDVDVGLASYFYSKDIGRVWRVAEALETGMVGINTGILSQAQVPFGGIKESGFGREGGSSITEFMVDKLMVFGPA